MAITGALSQGLVAKIIVGTATIQSDTNTFTGLMPGVDVTLAADAAKNDTATITIGRDTQSLTDRVKGMVEVLNGALDETREPHQDRRRCQGQGSPRRRLDAARCSGQADRVRHARCQRGVARDVRHPGRSLRQADLRRGEVQGRLHRRPDQDVGRCSPERTTRHHDRRFRRHAPGVVQDLQRLDRRHREPQSIKSRQSAIRGWEDDIADWDVRLAARQTTLQRQYTALESALGKLQSQGNWLAGQIASLPQMSSGS